MGKLVKVYSARDITQAYLMKFALEDYGIEVLLDNEPLLSLIPSVPYGTGTAPHLLVDEAQAAEARKILVRLEEAARAGPDPDADPDGEVPSLRFRWPRFRWLRFRWRRFLPGYPAILLVPAILGLWVGLTWANKDYSFQTRPHVRNPSYGIPLSFMGHRDDQWCKAHSRRHKQVYGFWIDRFLIDLAIALASAYIVGMAADRLLFPAIRAARRRKRGAGEAG